jgi:hypothetical protein
MLKIWVDVNVNVDTLIKCVVAFFEGKNFEVRDKRSGGKAIIEAVNKIKKVSFVVEVRRYNSSLEIGFAPKEQASLRLFGNLFAIFGGGYYSVQTLKSKELGEKLEPEFWLFITNIIGSDDYQGKQGVKA